MFALLYEPAVTAVSASFAAVTASSAILAVVTARESIVKVDPLDDTTMSPLSPSENVV